MSDKTEWLFSFIDSDSIAGLPDISTSGLEVKEEQTIWGCSLGYRLLMFQIGLTWGHHKEGLCPVRDSEVRVALGPLAQEPAWKKHHCTC